jgi:hypothetical protein
LKSLSPDFSASALTYFLLSFLLVGFGLRKGDGTCDGFRHDYHGGTLGKAKNLILQL